MAISVARSEPTPLKMFSKYNDVIVAIAVLSVIGMMVIPMPEWTLDMLLTLNITSALTILLVTVYTTEPLQFSSFPGILLVSTLFRLALNIAATRLILLNGSAGGIISAFGSVVVGGNYVVGIVVFAILIIVQFVVITNGTSRVAEVAARFTLDAMPGKQMAIDADLNAGIIDEQEAQSRRRAVSRQADFYGAMDGSSKFVRGDTIAAIVMIVVNILGGFIVGIVQRHMDFMAALQTYTLLTIGEGLVTQIPSLLISSAAGLMVTKTASDGNLGSDMAQQLLAQPKAIGITACVSACLALVPGIPKLPFILAAAGGFWFTYLMRQQSRVKKMPATKSVVEAPRSPEAMTDLLSIDPIELELGYGLIPLADPKQGGDLLERITAVRRRAVIDLGVLIPAIRVRDNLQLKPNIYILKLRGLEVARGELYSGHLMAMNPGTAVSTLNGIETTEPAFGLPAVWISEVQRSEAELSGYTIIDPLTVLVTHLTELLRKHAPEILTRQDTQVLVDVVRPQCSSLISELIPEMLSIGDVQKVLQNLLAERVSIRDMACILETLSDAVRLTRDTDALTEYVRQGLSRQIMDQYKSVDGAVHLFTLDPAVEQLMAENIRQADSGSQLVLDPDSTQRILNATKLQVERLLEDGQQPIALSSPRTRIHYRRLVERFIPTLAVLSYGEIGSGTGIETVGMVSVSYENAQN